VDAGFGILHAAGFSQLINQGIPKSIDDLAEPQRPESLCNR
jgi:hypothetical protein